MRRVGALVLALVATALCMGFTVIALSESDGQLAQRVARMWPHGRLEVARPSLAGLHTLAAEKLSHSRRRPAVKLVLNDLEWTHDGLWSGARGAKAGKHELRFDAGKFDLEIEAAPSLRAAAVVGQEAPPPQWFADLPDFIAGNRVEVSVRSSGRRGGTVITGVELRGAELRRDGDGIRVSAALHSVARPRPIWLHGDVRGFFNADGMQELSLRIGDADLGAFEFKELDALLGFPWPVELPDLNGRANIRWELGAGHSEVVVDHLQASFSVPGLPQALRALAGSVEMGSDRATWRIDGGVYSRTRVDGALSFELLTRRASGQLFLRDFLDDRGLALGLPRLWHALREQFPLAGRGEMEIRVDGVLGTDLWKAVRQIRISVEKVTAGAGARLEPITLELAVSRQDAKWVFSGKVDAVEYRGFRIEPGTWSGYLDGRGLLIERACAPEESARIDVEVDDHVMAFRCSLENLLLSDLLTFPFGKARGSLQMAGTWEPNGTLEWQALLNFRDVSLPEGAPWPVRVPQGSLEGDLCIRCSNDVITFPWIRVRDAAGVWLAFGKLSRDGQWDLAGTAIAGGRRFPMPMDVAQRVTHAPEGGASFHLMGRFFEWRAQ